MRAVSNLKPWKKGQSGNPSGKSKRKGVIANRDELVMVLSQKIRDATQPSTGLAACARMLCELMPPDELTAPEAPASAGPSNAIPKRPRRELEALLTRDPDPELDEPDPVIAAAGVTQTTV